MKDAEHWRGIARGLFDALKRISVEYGDAEYIRRAVERPKSLMYGLQPDEAIEMAYDNVQAEARDAIKGMRRP